MKRRSPALLKPVRREVVSPAEFQRIVRESPHLIERSRFVSPTIGKRDFGSFELHYSVPVLRPAEEELA
jgi:hypothetical protein